MQAVISGKGEGPIVTKEHARLLLLLYGQVPRGGGPGGIRVCRNKKAWGSDRYIDKQAYK